MSAGMKALLWIFLAACNQADVDGLLVEKMPVDNSSQAINPADVDRLLIFPSEIDGAIGDTFALKALAHVVNAEELTDVSDKVLWTVSDTNKASLSDSQQGYLQLKSTGSFTLTASFGIRTSTLSANVSNPSVRNIELHPPQATLAIGQTTQFKLTEIQSDYSVRSLSNAAVIAIADEKIARVTRLPNGEIQLNALAVGSTELSVQRSIAEDSEGTSLSTRTWEFSVVVTDRKILSLNLMIDRYTPAIGQAIPLELEGIYSDGLPEPLRQRVGFTTVPLGCAYLPTSTQLIATMEGLCEVTFTYAQLRIVKNLAVQPTTLTRLRILPSPLLIAAGTGTYLSAIGTYSDGSTRDLTRLVNWSTPGLAALWNLSNAGGTKGYLTGNSPGISTVTASYGEFADTISGEVTNAAIESITVGPTQLTVDYGSSLAGKAFTATARLSNGATQDITELVTWTLTWTQTSSAPTIAPTISNNAGTRGHLTSIGKAGQAVVTASFNSPENGLLQSNATLLVEKVLSSLAIEATADVSPTDAAALSRVAQGRTQNHRLMANYNDGTVINMTNRGVWRMNYSSGSYGAHGYLDSTISTLYTMFHASDSSLGTMAIEVVFEGQTIVREVEVTAAEISTFICSASSSIITVAETSNVSCSVAYTNGTSLDAATIDANAALSVSWTAPSTSGITLAGAGSYSSSSGAAISFTPSASGEGYVRLAATLTAASTSYSSNVIALTIRSVCASGTRFGGDSNTSDGIYCWKIGNAGDSCTATCNTLSYQVAGTSYGAGASVCNALRNAVYTPSSGRVSVGGAPSFPVAGLGCSVEEFSFITTDYYRIFNGETANAAASEANSRRICACGS